MDKEIRTSRVCLLQRAATFMLIRNLTGVLIPKTVTAFVPQGQGRQWDPQYPRDLEKKTGTSVAM